VEVLAEYQVPEGRAVAELAIRRVVVAVRQGQLLGTAFHPEITADTRWHQLFISMCEKVPAGAAQPVGADTHCLPLTSPPPLPVF
jgi:5'-phosphate synthase pdxT subunit